MTVSRRVVLGQLAAAGLVPALVAGGQATAPTAAGPVYVCYYWRARPGREQDYSNHITGNAERIDEHARQAGAFAEVRTVLSTRPADGPAPEWTHLRIFTVKDMAAADALAGALDAATTRMVPDEATRKANGARSAGMRDFVRREVWTSLH